jgi:hypothetical protein
MPARRQRGSVSREARRVIVPRCVRPGTGAAASAHSRAWENATSRS